jgi:galactosylceramidase
MAMWRSNANEHFVRQADIAPAGGRIALTLDPDSVYSLTTTRGQHKAAFDNVPERKAFPFPYRETFEQYDNPEAWGYLPRYFADIAGAFELAKCPDSTGKCLRQAAPVPTIPWAPDWKPYTILGDDAWSDYEVSVDVRLAAGESAAVMGRINHVGTGYGILPQGYLLQLGHDGQLQLIVARQGGQEGTGRRRRTAGLDPGTERYRRRRRKGTGHRACRGHCHGPPVALASSGTDA